MSKKEILKKMVGAMVPKPVLSALDYARDIPNIVQKNIRIAKKPLIPKKKVILTSTLNKFANSLPKARDKGAPEEPTDSAKTYAFDLVSMGRKANINRNKPYNEKLH